MTMTTAEHVLVVGAAAVAVGTLAPIALPIAAGAAGATAVVAALGAWTGISLTGVGAGLGAGWLTHWYLNKTGVASVSVAAPAK